MKTFTALLFMAVCLSLTTCKKDHLSTISDTTLTGKWTLTASLADPGDGSGKWTPISSSTSYVQFDNDGKLEGTAFTDYVNYTVKDSVTLSFFTKDKVLQNYRYNINNGTLTMSPAGPIMCFEACGTRYTKVK
jgi:hypothetical protein